MFTKTTIILLILYQASANPLESAQPKYDVKNFLSSRIVGGHNAPEGYGKYMVALVSGYHVKALACGGSIIGLQHVLSAAHCIEPHVYWGVLSPHLKGVVGSNNWNSSQYIHFSGYHNHPHWNWATLKNDIGVLKTTKKIVYNERVGPVRLSFGKVDGGTKVFVLGWGRIEAWGEIPYKLQMLSLTTISGLKCIKAWKEISAVVGPTPPVDPALEICTFHSYGHGMCNGDSGSPLMSFGLKQVGIVSWGKACARGAPDVYVRISAFKTFLSPYISSHLEDITPVRLNESELDPLRITR